MNNIVFILSNAFSASRYATQVCFLVWPVVSGVTQNTFLSLLIFYHDAYDIDIDVESDVVSFTDDIRVYTSRTFWTKLIIMYQKKGMLLYNYSHIKLGRLGSLQSIVSYLKHIFFLILFRSSSATLHAVQ